MCEQKVRNLLAEGDDRIRAGEFDEALALYRKAVELVPEPFEAQPLSTDILTAIGDAYFFKSEYAKAERAFTDVRLCPGAAANEYIRLRRGQVAYELGDLKKAATELACAYMNGGEDVFKGEEPKYFQLVQTTLRGVSK